MGRKRKIHPESFKIKLVKEYESGEIDAVEFAKQKGISPFTFKKWIKNYKEPKDLEFKETILNNPIKPSDVFKEAKDIAININGVLAEFRCCGYLCSIFEENNIEPFKEEKHYHQILKLNVRVIRF